MKEGTKRLFSNQGVVQYIPLFQVDQTDRAYATLPEWWRNPSLESSIEKVGILNPLHVQENGRGFRIISGYQRAAAAYRLKIDPIPCLLVDQAEPLTLFLQNLWENSGTRELHELEKARAVTLLHRAFGVAESELVDAVLPALGIPGSRYHLDRLMEIDRLPEQTKKAMVDAGLAADLALNIAKWGTREQEAALELIRHLKPGRNRQKILLDLLDDLKVLLQTDISRLCGEILSVFHSEDGSQAQQTDRIIEHLRRKKYPRLSQQEDRYRELRRQLSIPPSIQMHPPSFFEGTSLSFSFNASSPDELKQITARLRELTGKRALNEIFRLL